MLGRLSIWEAPKVSVNSLTSSNSAKRVEFETDGVCSITLGACIDTIEPHDSHHIGGLFGWTREDNRYAPALRRGLQAEIKTHDHQGGCSRLTDIDRSI